MRRFALFAFLVAAVCGCKWGDDFKIPPPSTTRLPQAQDQPFYDSLDDVAIRLAVQVPGDERGNMVFSPLAAEHGMLMLMGGSSNKAYDELMAVFGANEDNKKALYESQRALLNRIEALDGGPVHVGSAVFTLWPILIDRSYAERMGATFGSPARKLGAAGVESTRLVNEWASQATDGRIPSVVQGLDRDEPLLVFGVADVQADWTDGWTEVSGEFSSGGKKAAVNAFASTQDFRLRSSPVADAVSVPFADGELTLILIVPKGENGPKEALAEAATTGWAKYRAGMERQRVRVVAPLFSLTQTTRLNDAVAAIGCGSLFNEACNLRPMSIEMERGYKVSKIAHDAAFTTVVRPGRSQVQPAASKELKADRPFAFVVSDAQTGAVLMVGTVGDPTQ